MCGYYGNPHEFVVASDKEGFFVENEFGEEAEVRSVRYTTHKAAAERIAYILDNWEPPSPRGWEGGFADNH